MSERGEVLVPSFRAIADLLNSLEGELVEAGEEGNDKLFRSQIHVRAPIPFDRIRRSVNMFARWKIDRGEVLETDVFEVLLEVRVRLNRLFPDLLKLGDGCAEDQVLKRLTMVERISLTKFGCDVSFQMSIAVCPCGRRLRNGLQNPSVSIGTNATLLSSEMGN